MDIVPNQWNVSVTMVGRVTFVTNLYAVLVVAKRMVIVTNLVNVGVMLDGQVRNVKLVSGIQDVKMVDVTNHGNATAQENM